MLCVITSHLPDFHTDKFRLLVDKFHKSDFTDVSILDELNIQRVRISSDNVGNGYGRKFLEFCINNEMFILNGRIGKDKFGRPISRNLS